MSWPEEDELSTGLQHKNPQSYPEAARPLVSPQYTEDDFVELSSDSAISRVYVNGNFELWWLPAR